MNISEQKSLFERYKEPSIFGRYLNNSSLKTWRDKLSPKIRLNHLGVSVEHRVIISLTIGSGSTKIFLWSQMHGNESTTTKSVIDLLNVLSAENEFAAKILSRCTIKVIPILNPDGAEAYARVNANTIDLNRDAQALSQPESRILRDVFDRFKPDYCFNLHDQRSIFGAGACNASATVSFLSPAEDAEISLTPNRKKAMTLIAQMNANLQQQIPGQVGVYDDAYNANCVGDTFQALAPTILFEAGQFKQDYQREITRQFIFQSLLVAMEHIATPEVSTNDFSSYLDIPRNEKCFYDVIIRNTKQQDIAIQYEERLVGQSVDFVPKVVKIGPLNSEFAHLELQANNQQVLSEKKEVLKVGSEIVCVMMNNEKIALKPKFI
ncbi:peptidase M14 [Subsaximicrobium wynnwilliamsii]|uniref:Peptidase M14 n=1 Tax=Subsaximicrobium wynnwilliamsii TaxID=291179 RepID=A0A5C6ZFK6_9FLAO|nr:M14 family zinc carboxypeptidase [Subsaximicrobium wynnwilliamsii]TXD82923.1 peptidase M14 [Subsaximicrobium wynnwilliamsii]TXD88644.1 peptidase M14 [Subsaximicrobium wynnwilliamsii]TXE02737.1 peptidase M14 [Subsaximicrobium wynnwilliamsii]